MKIHYSYKALTQLESFPTALQERIVRKMIFFGNQVDSRKFAKRISGTTAFRFRVGDYRIICDIRTEVIEILFIERRDKAYD